jgi:hypothetical protein
MRIYLIILSLAACCFSCSTETKDYRAFTTNTKLYTQTVFELNRVVMHDNFTPPVANRNYTYANIAAYECIAAGYPEEFQSLSGQLNGLKPMPQPENTKSIDFEFAAVLAFCKVGVELTFSESLLEKYVDSLKREAKQFGMPNATLKATEKFSTAIAQAILDWAKDDNYLQTRTAIKFNVTQEPGRWIPTPPMYAEAVEPAWNQIRPLVMDSANQISAPPPFPYNVSDTSSAFYQEAVKLKRASETLTDDQRHMADFWDDNPFKLNVVGHVMYSTKKFSPPGHWMGIAGIGGAAVQADFPKLVCAYAKTSIALFEAFIQCWNEKYEHSYVRPETVINQHIDPEWRPYLQTPPFPEYTAGHTTTSAAAAAVLTEVFGDQIAFTDTTELEFGIPSRSFTSFRHAAEENIWARFYGGIHYYHTCEVSNKLGNEIGEFVSRKLIMNKLN